MRQQKKAFTLIELLVVIAIIWIIILWASSLNFNAMSDKQKSNWFFYKIKTNIETIQNNALIWKAILVWGDLEVPKKWRIDFNNSWSGKIVSYYSIDWINFVEYNKILPKQFYEIIVKNNSLQLNTTWSILIVWWNLSLTWITSSRKELEIKTRYKNFEKIFTINTISWVIEEQ